MVWFRVDDKLWGHPKWVACSPRARALWSTAGSWSMDQLTDGKVPLHILAILGGSRKDAAELVERGLWEDHPEGWQFHDWGEFQPTAEQVKAERAAAKERQKRARDAARAKRAARESSGEVTPSSRRDSRRDEGVTHGVSHGPPDPTRPDPTRSSYGTTTDADASVSRAPRSEPEGFDRFEEFWETYGHKKDRANALNKWRLALRKPGVTADLLINAAAAYVLWERAENEGGRFIMGAAKWLLNERWTDERPERPAPLTPVQGWLRLTEEIAEQEHGGNVSLFPRQLGGAS